MGDYVLSVWTAGEEPAGGAGIRLCRAGVDVPVAEHATGFDVSPFVVGGAEVDPGTSLTAAGLMNKARQVAVGAELWARLTPGTIGAALLPPVLRTERIYLDLRSDELLRLPWELLRRGNSYLFTNPGARWSLGRPEPDPGALACGLTESGHPLRILVVLGNDPADDRIRASEELMIIEREARLRNAEVLLTALHHPEGEEIEKALVTFRPHVFHFIGHGSDDAEEAPLLSVHTTAKDRDDWDADRIREVFAEAPPRVVVLNACQTAHAPTEASSLVQAFLEVGCIAAVAMMGDIEGAASEAFSGKFYAAIFDGAPVDVATTAARRTISALARGPVAGGSSQVRSNWPLPRLTVRGDVDDAVTMRYARRRPADRWLTPDFVARWGERWRAWSAMDGGLRLDGAEARLAVLWGEKDHGKRELLNALAEARARAGDAVLDVDLSGGRTGRWPDVLRRIAEAAGESGLDAAALGATAAAGGPSAPVIERFRSDLERLSDGTVLVVLDGLSDWIPDEVNDTVLPELCAPFLRAAPGSRVRMMISLQSLPGPAVWGRRPEHWAPIEVGRFDDEEWPRAITQFRDYWSAKVPAKEADLAMLAAAMMNQPYARSLEYLRGTAKERR